MGLFSFKNRKKEREQENGQGAPNVCLTHKVNGRQNTCPGSRLNELLLRRYIWDDSGSASAGNPSFSAQDLVSDDNFAMLNMFASQCFDCHVFAGVFLERCSTSGAAIRLTVDRQVICPGCWRIEVLMGCSVRSGVRKDSNLPNLIPREPTLHSDFAELNVYAEDCTSCRIFRQALLFRCTTSEAADGLASSTQGRPVKANFVFPPSASGPQGKENRNDHNNHPLNVIITLEIDADGGKIKSAPIECLTSIQMGPGAATAAAETVPTPINLSMDPCDEKVTSQIGHWVSECHSQHVECLDLSWSTQNPTRLLELAEDGSLRLVMTSTQEKRQANLPQSSYSLLQYIAVSYSWGTQTLNSAEEACVEAGKTVMGNIERRTRRMDAEELPATLRDAVTLARRVGVKYVWIDSVCIMQDSHADWIAEAPRMHEYYGNALFTLYVAANIKVTEPLLRPRSAWAFSTHPCRLSGRWLKTTTAPLSIAYSSSPLAQRGWTLQEERLSPRIVYWTPHRLYWSCSQHELSEREGDCIGDVSSTLQLSRVATPLPQPQEQPSSLSPTSRNGKGGRVLKFSAHSFLLSTLSNSDDTEIHDQWLAILQSYTQRSLTQPIDTFPALAGLAARYLSARKGNDTYIASLWRRTFARDLAWGVKSMPSSSDRSQSSIVHNNRRTLAPSWSWASLPQGTTTIMGISHTTVDDFALLDVITTPSSDDAHDRNDAAPANDPITLGAMVKQVHVRGRLRPLKSDDAVIRPWGETFYYKPTGLETAFVPAKPEWEREQPVFAVNAQFLGVLAYEGYGRDLMGRLDYEDDAIKVEAGRLTLWALQVVAEAALLLESIAGDDQHQRLPCYRRVGLAQGNCIAFFHGAKMEELYLV